ncbi:MAG: transpeptidase family protein [Flavobacteriales bacterium]|jgi:cell division protein FtsI (penicillin-binding protein 3)|nr:transpeptidase family protein [Flavobacteriales bacterium]NCG29256.1 PASTA domain-containing protein [Bacteroidota bacterium]MBT4705155.1 transpeptidase family protein [Flavobacteriales bacterium]MBT4930175.1 transpeptidase family protein [Flavobacteriales bacterium]MBT5133133.1 transpeptidase family protein [Flavobacteriales bacterium]
MAEEKNREFMIRSLVVFSAILLFGLAVMVKAVLIQVVEGDYWREKAENLTTVYRDIEAVRGNIYSDDGSMMATSVPIYEVRMDLNADGLKNEVFNSEIDSLSICLAGLFKEQSAVEWKRELVTARQNGSRYHLIKRRVKYGQMKALREFPIFNLGKYQGGLIVLQQNKREKPFRMLAARTIGYDREGVTPVGLEGAYSAELAGVSGKRLMQKISGGLWMPINDENEIEPMDGYDIHTTVNLNIQDVAENALLKQLERHDAHHGCVILMEVETGAIKAIANLSRDDDGDYWEYYNYAIGESAEPGSTFKLPSLVVALEDGFIELKDSVDAGNGKAEFHGETMRDSKEGGYGKISVKETFAYSSNIGLMRLIERHYANEPAKFIKGLRKMNLGEPIGIEIAGEGDPLIKDPSNKSWSLISYLWSSIGYEVKMTPLQILTFYNAIANDGKMMKPQFVRRVTNKSSVVKEFEPQVISKQVCSIETAKKAQELMKAVVNIGTAKNLKSSNYQIAGKTGTARIAKSSEGYGKKISYQASFAGYFPADNPKYSCIVVVNAPNRAVYYASHVAAPIFEEIADKVYATSIKIHDELQEQGAITSLTKVPVSKNGSQRDLTRVFEELHVPVSSDNPEEKWVVTQTGHDKVRMGRRAIVENLVPNVIGMSVQDAVFILENSGLKVRMKGRGVIKEQSIAPGERIIRGQNITLEMS